MVCRVRSSLLAAAGMVFLREIEVHRNMLNTIFLGIEDTELITLINLNSREHMSTNIAI